MKEEKKLLDFLKIYQYKKVFLLIFSEANCTNLIELIFSAQRIDI